MVLHSANMAMSPNYSVNSTGFRKKKHSVTHLFSVLEVCILNILLYSSDHTALVPPELRQLYGTIMAVLYYCYTTVLAMAVLYYYDSTVLLWKYCTTMPVLYYYASTVLLCQYCTAMPVLYYYATTVLL